MTDDYFRLVIPLEKGDFGPKIELIPKVCKAVVSLIIGLHNFHKFITFVNRKK